MHTTDKRVIRRFMVYFDLSVGVGFVGYQLLNFFAKVSLFFQIGLRSRCENRCNRCLPNDFFHFRCIQTLHILCVLYM